MDFCKLLKTCFLFKYGFSELPVTAEYMKFKYCLGNYTSCPWYLDREELRQIADDEQ